MKFDYDGKIYFKPGQSFDINYVKNICKNNPNKKLLIEVQNTKGITSSMIKELGDNIAFRIAGGYDEERVNRKKNTLYTSGETGEYFISAVIYSKNETIKILETIEKIESGINENWSDIQKLVYIYEKLKTSILYDPKFEDKLSSETRSLRGLITKQTVCAGYSMILKEFMDRSNIECEYVEGWTKKNHKGAHAWNIITIEGKKYPIDLTWDNTKYRAGELSTFAWLGQSIKVFSESHFPEPEEKTQDYIHTLSQIDQKTIKQIYSIIGSNRTKDYKTTIYRGTREDNSKFIVAQIGDAKINGVKYYRYYFLEDNGLPLILYSETNLTYLVDSKKFDRSIPKGYETAITDILFSKENIMDSLSKRTFYIGRASKNEIGKEPDPVTSCNEIIKSEEKRNLFNYQTKRMKRSDESIFIIQKMDSKPIEIRDTKVFKFDILEMVKENGETVLKRNVVYTENDLFEDNRQRLKDDFLSRSRLNRKSKEYGGYIGYYDKNGIRRYNQSLLDFFGTSRRVEIEDLNKPKYEIPKFSELKDLVSRYEIYIDSQNPYDQNPNNIKIRDIKTKSIVTDKKIFKDAMLANIWLSSAGIKYYEDDIRPGYNYAFNEAAETLYNAICKQLSLDCKLHKVIDTVSLLRNAPTINNYKYNEDIVLGLFRSKYQTAFLNTIFLESLGINNVEKSPQPLFSATYAYDLAYGTSIDNQRKR